MAEHEAPELEGGEDRRSALKKIGIGAAAAWSAPVILGSMEAASGTGDDTGGGGGPTNCVCGPQNQIALPDVDPTFDTASPGDPINLLGGGASAGFWIAQGVGTVSIDSPTARSYGAFSAGPPPSLGLPDIPFPYPAGGSVGVVGPQQVILPTAFPDPGDPLDPDAVQNSSVILATLVPFDPSCAGNTATLTVDLGAYIPSTDLISGTGTPLDGQPRTVSLVVGFAAIFDDTPPPLGGTGVLQTFATTDLVTYPFAAGAFAPPPFAVQTTQGLNGPLPSPPFPPTPPGEPALGLGGMIADLSPTPTPVLPTLPPAATQGVAIVGALFVQVWNPGLVLGGFVTNATAFDDPTNPAIAGSYPRASTCVVDNVRFSIGC